MAVQFLGTQALLAVGGLIGRALFGPDDEDGPEVAAYEARGEVRSEVATRRWVVGTARVAGVLIRHADLVFAQYAESWYRQNPNDEGPNDLLREASNLMHLYGYFAYALAEGETDGIAQTWVDGVRADLAGPGPASATSTLDDGEFAPPVDAANQPEPLYGDRFVPDTVLRTTNADIDQDIFRQRLPAIAIWQAKGEQGPATGKATNLAARKLREVYSTGRASETEKTDIDQVHGRGVTWVLVRLSQGNLGDQPEPWRRVPQLDFLVKGKGPAAPEGVDGYLLDGNPAKAAYWFLTERMGVAPGLVDDVWMHSVTICDEPFLVNRVDADPVATDADVLRATRNPSWIRVLREVALSLNLDPESSASIRPAIAEWKRRRLVRVVERFTGLEYDAVDAETRASIVARWNERFTGSADADGERARYRANGVISADADPAKVLEGLAQSMAGSIEEHGGRWYIRAGSLTLRPANVITDTDIVSDSVQQQLEPPVEDQPTEVRASIIQNERLEFERFVMAPVNRVDANLGEIDATNRPAFLREANPSPDRVRDLGDMTFVTDPLQADELMRIALYRTRWNTRTIRLAVRPNKDFSFYAISKGAPILINSKSEDIHGERVGERTDSMRCVVVETPRYDEDGNIELVLQQQDEEVFGEKFGLVLDYHDAGDVILVPPPTPPPAQPPTCAPLHYNGHPGDVIFPQRIEEGTGLTLNTLQAVGTGGTGRLTYALQWLGANPGLSIDSSTGYISGTIRADFQTATYTGRVSVTDTKGVTGSCTVTIGNTRYAQNPYIVLDGVDDVVAGTSDSWTASVVYPQHLAYAYRHVPIEAWTFSLEDAPSWMSITESGAGTSAPSASVTTSESVIHSGTVVASAALGTQPIKAYANLRVLPVPTAACEATTRTVQVKRNTALSSTSMIQSIRFGTGGRSPAQVAVDRSRTSSSGFSPLPAGLALSSTGELSGTTSAVVGRYTVPVTITDSSSPTQSCCTSCSFVVDVRPQLDATVTLHPTDATVTRSNTGQIGVRAVNFQGTTTCSIQAGPAWLTVAPGAGPHDHILRIGATKPVGREDYSIVVTDTEGTSETAAGTITVRADPAPPMTMDDETVEVKTQEAYTGGLTVKGGPDVAPIYTWDDGETAVADIGLNINRVTGSFWGTAPATEGTHTYTAKVTRGTVETTCTVTVIISPAKDDPQDETECLDGTVEGAPGERVSLSTAIVCTTAYLPFTSQRTTAPPGWTAQWNEQPPLSDGQAVGGSTFQFSTTIPRTATTGNYRFTNVFADSRGTEATAVVVVTVSTAPVRPIRLTGRNPQQINTPASRIFTRTFRATGGPATGSYSFTARSLPSYMTLTTGGILTIPAQNQHRSGSFKLIVTKDTTTAEFDISFELTTNPGGGTPPIGEDSLI